MDILNTKYNIILGSKSPRRKELLELIGLKFQVKDNNVIETYSNKLKPYQIAEYLSKKKAAAYIIDKKDLIICADTIVYNENILAKPKNKDDAFNMLSSLSNKEHTVITGVTIKTIDTQITFHESSVVNFYSLNEKEILYYINNFNSLDKAGAYGIQEWIGAIGIRNIKGSFYNVMGMPTSKLYQLLKTL